jgi:FtsP/CotA-like multicopper oxidase with cupredoxin domain
MPAKPSLPRRDFLKLSGLAALSPSMSVFSPSNAQSPSATGSKADYTLRIARGNMERSPGHVVATTLYNGQFPGPMVRLTEGRRVIVDVYNDIPEVAHWHGQMIPSEVDGAIEEGTPVIPPHGMRRIDFIPKPSGRSPPRGS